MKTLALVAITVAAFAAAQTSKAAPTPNVACGPICIGGDGRPPCLDWNLGSYWTANGHRWICGRVGSTDQWVPLF